MTTRAITFDWWGTLFRDANGVPRQAIRVDAFVDATGADREAVEGALKAVWVEFDRSHREDQRTLTSHDAVRMAAGKLAVTLTPDTVDELAEVFACAVLHHAAVPIDGALDAVKAAAARVPVGIISDTGVSPGRVLRQLMDRHGFTQWFRAMTWSDELDGLSKPRAVNFEHTAQALGVAPNQLLHIGDLPHTDIAGAKAVNARAALFTGVNNFPAFTEPEPDYVFGAWPEFIQLLPSLLG